MTEMNLITLEVKKIDKGILYIQEEFDNCRIDYQIDLKTQKTLFCQITELDNNNKKITPEILNPEKLTEYKNKIDVHYQEMKVDNSKTVWNIKPTSPFY